MGYYTYYNLNMKSTNDTPINYEAINRAFIHIYDGVYEVNTLKDKWVKECINNPDFINDFYLNENQKWYEFNEDMVKLSEMFPDVVFCLWGEGEDRDDNWRKVYNNGSVSSSVGHITYTHDPMYEKYFK